MIVKKHVSDGTTTTGPHSPVRKNITKNKKGPRIHAVRPRGPAFKAFFLARQQMYSSLATFDRAPVDLSSLPPLPSEHVNSEKEQESTRSLPMPPPSPTALARLPDPVIRVSYRRKLVGGDTMDNQKICSVAYHNDARVIVSDADSDEDRRDQAIRPPCITRRRVVHFHPFVQVVEIPTRSDYSFVDSKNLWTSRSWLRKEVRRNKSEFRADESDWRLCKEEEDMVDVGDGELVHPYTYERMVGCHLLTKREQTDSLGFSIQSYGTTKTRKRRLWEPN